MAGSFAIEANELGFRSPAQSGRRRFHYSIKGNTTGEVASQVINVVLNWFEELKQRVPVL